MISSFLALTLTMVYMDHSCSAKSLPSISVEKNDFAGNSLSLFQNSEFELNNLFCLSAGCVEAASSIINNMDQSVNPCDDFYQFACGNFMKNTNLNDQEISRTSFSMVQDAILNQKRMILAEPIQTDELRPFKMMKLLFKSCMDKEHIEKLGLAPIKKMLKSVGGWPVLEAEKWDESKFTWMDSMQKLTVPGKVNRMDYFFEFSVGRDLKNHTKTAIYLEQASYELPQEFLVEGTSSSIVGKYYRYMVDIAVLFGADPQRAHKELKESLDFEIELAKISNASPGEVLYDDKLYNPMKIADLQQKFPSIPWEEFLNKLLNQPIRTDDIIIVFSPNYWSGFETLISKTPKRVLANYVIQRSVFDSLRYLTEELRKIKYEFDQVFYFDSKIKMEILRWEECVDISFNLFKTAVGSMYVRRFFDENAKQNALEMVNVIKEEVYKLLSSNKWMDDETRNNAMDKAKLMINEIAYPDELLDDSKLNAFYENLEVNDQDFYASVLNLTKFNTDYEFSKYKNPNWIWHSDFTLMTNAYYFSQYNKILVPAGILQSVFFSNDRPKYMIYSGIGSIIGHEIIHGYDNIGRKFDKHGNRVDWWTAESNKRFLEKEKCFINQYGNYTVNEVGLKVNGTLTLGENIADDGGLRVANNAYREWVKVHGVEPRLPGLQQYTPQQMFWLSAANVWCTKDSMNAKRHWIDRDSHSPQHFRIIGSFSNNKDFSEDFRCPLGSNMNPEKKCQLW